MKNCELCKHYEHRISDYPCKYCHFKNNKPYWDPTDEIAEVIEAAERKAFQAGWEGAIDTYEAGDVREYLHEDFEKWKEENK